MSEQKSILLFLLLTLNKREAFEKAYDNFDIDKIINYDDKKIEELINNKDIIRNKLKIKSSINNAKIFKQISEEYKGFYNYLKTFTIRLLVITNVILFDIL